MKMTPGLVYIAISVDNFFENGHRDHHCETGMVIIHVQLHKVCALLLI